MRAVASRHLGAWLVQICLVLIPRKVNKVEAAVWSVFTSLPQPLMAVLTFYFTKQVCSRNGQDARKGHTVGYCKCPGRYIRCIMDKPIWQTPLLREKPVDYIAKPGACALCIYN